MKVIIQSSVVVLFLFCGFFMAQNIRVAYDYEFALDSTNLADKKSELMYLDINEKGSKFYSYQVFRDDSLAQERLKAYKNGGNISLRENFTGTFRQIVEKKYPDRSTNTFVNLGQDFYVVEEKPHSFKWEILNEKVFISNVEVIKATTFAFGRRWYAYFAPQYTFHDGPWKFSGLPGLILKIEDEKKSHVFNFAGLVNLPNNDWISEKSSRKKYIPINSVQYKKVFLNDRNKSARLEESFGGGLVRFEVSDESGKKLNLREVQEMRDKLKLKTNNILDLDLLK